MNGDFLGGGIVFAISAVLWLVYLVPALWRKHTFDATEKNAVRLNQTLRALVETSEAPQELRLEATARAVAQQQRILRKAEAQARRQLRASTWRSLAPEMQAARVTPATRANGAPAGTRATPVTRSRKRDRMSASVVLLVSLAAVGWGAVEFVANGQWGFVAGGLFGVVTASLILRNIAPGRARKSQVAQQESRPARRRSPDQVARANSGWVPASIPAPLTSRAGSLARTTVEAQRAHEQLLRDAAIDAAVAAHTDVVQPAVEPVSQPAAALVERERLASMGLIGNTGDVELDLTEALRRRRTGS